MSIAPVPKDFVPLQKFLDILAKAYLKAHPDFVTFAQNGDPALDGKSGDALTEELALYPGVIAIAAHEYAHKLYNEGTKASRVNARRISEAAKTRTGIDIHPGTAIGEDCFIDHGTGVVIGETAHIGKNARVYHGVTFGAYGKPKDIRHRHPVIGDNCVVSVGVNILGHVQIGNKVVIRPNARLLGNNLVVEDDVKIGAGAQIGDGNILKKGLRVGDDVIIPSGTGEIRPEDFPEVAEAGDNAKKSNGGGYILAHALVTRDEKSKLLLTWAESTKNPVGAHARAAEKKEIGFEI